jgi:hypothetical protein
MGRSQIDIRKEARKPKKAKFEKIVQSAFLGLSTGWKKTNIP